MAENSKIEWCDHTFNPWIGCTKVSPACDNCYAERDMDHRFGRVKWGAGQERSRTTVQNWNKPKRWNKEAENADRRPRVFCASLADVFDTEVEDMWRWDLFKLIRETPNLDWLLLTKRPAVSKRWFSGLLTKMKGGPDWQNVWLGTSVENEEMAKARIPYLSTTKYVAKRFLSMEPLLEPVNIDPWLYREGICGNIDWIIVGGESGPGRREMPVHWAEQVLKDCRTHNVPFLLKQMTGGTYAEKQDIPEPILVREYPA